MPLVYVAVIVVVVIAGDSVSPIGQQPLWKQALGFFGTTTPSGSDTLYARQLQWEKEREKRTPEREQKPTATNRMLEGTGHATERPSDAEMRQRFNDIGKAFNR